MVFVLGASKANFDTISAMAGIPGVRLVVTDGDRNSVCRDLPPVFEAADITSGPAVLAVARKDAVQGIYAMNDHVLRSCRVCHGPARTQGYLHGHRARGARQRSDA